MLKRIVCFLILLNIRSMSFGMMTELQQEAYKYGWQGGADAVKHLVKTSSPVIATASSGIKDLVKEVSLGGLKVGWNGLKSSALHPSLFLIAGAMASMYLVGRNANRTEILKNREEIKKFREEALAEITVLKKQTQKATAASVRAEKQGIKNGMVLDEHTKLHEQHLKEEQKTQEMIKNVQKEQQAQKVLMQKVLTQQKEMANESKEEFKRVHDDHHKHLELLNQLGENVGAMQNQITGFRGYMEQSNKERAEFESRQEARQEQLNQTFLLYSQQQNNMVQAQKDHVHAMQEKLDSIRMDMDMHQRENQASFCRVNKRLEKLIINDQCLEGLLILTTKLMNRNRTSSVGIMGANIGASINSYVKTKGKVFNIDSGNLIHFDMGSSSGSSDSID